MYTMCQTRGSHVLLWSYTLHSTIKKLKNLAINELVFLTFCQCKKCQFLANLKQPVWLSQIVLFYANFNVVWSWFILIWLSTLLYYHHHVFLQKNVLVSFWSSLVIISNLCYQLCFAVPYPLSSNWNVVFH